LGAPLTKARIQRANPAQEAGSEAIHFGWFSNEFALNFRTFRPIIHIYRTIVRTYVLVWRRSTVDAWQRPSALCGFAFLLRENFLGACRASDFELADPR